LLPKSPDSKTCLCTTGAGQSGVCLESSQWLQPRKIGQPRFRTVERAYPVIFVWASLSLPAGEFA